MSATPQEKKSYLKEVTSFYFLPGLHSLGTLMYLGIFGYFTLYYIDNIFLTLRFLAYIIFGHTVLGGSGHLFSGLVFVISLSLPFFTSVYAIFVLHRIWDKATWTSYVKWLMTFLVIVGSLIIITVSESTARFAAGQPSMQSFIEDAGLSGKI